MSPGAAVRQRTKAPGVGRESAVTPKGSVAMGTAAVLEAQGPRRRRPDGWVSWAGLLAPLQAMEPEFPGFAAAGGSRRVAGATGAAATRPATVSRRCSRRSRRASRSSESAVPAGRHTSDMSSSRCSRGAVAPRSSDRASESASAMRLSSARPKPWAICSNSGSRSSGRSTSCAALSTPSTCRTSRSRNRSSRSVTKRRGS